MLTVIFHQSQLFGYGAYLSQFEQITLLSRVAAFLGGDNMFKRYVYGNGKELMVLGYSITVFEVPLKKSDLAKMEHTWHAGWNLVYPERHVIPERIDAPGYTVKQTFYIVRSLSPFLFFLWHHDEQS